MLLSTMLVLLVVEQTSLILWWIPIMRDLNESLMRLLVWLIQKKDELSIPVQELQLRDRNFCGDFNARNKENSKNSNLDTMSYCQTKDEEESTKSCVWVCWDDASRRVHTSTKGFQFSVALHLNRKYKSSDLQKRTKLDPFFFELADFNKSWELRDYFTSLVENWWATRAQNL